MVVRRTINNGGTFDSTLSAPASDNGSTLTLTLRICLRQRNPPPRKKLGIARDSDSRKIKIQHWKPNEWSVFVKLFESNTESLWSHEFFLLPPAKTPAGVLRRLSHPNPKGCSRNRPFIRCWLDIEITERARGSHALLDCYRIADSEPRSFRSYIQNYSGRDYGRLANGDVSPEHGYSSELFYTVAHEVGHLLGLGHSNARSQACKRKGGDICYGKYGTARRRQIMGGGSTATKHEARPWMQRIGRHTGVRGGWKFVRENPSLPTLKQVLDGLPGP